MSLLMDALKRAEEAKRQNAAATGGADRTSAEGSGLSLEPISQSPLPDLSDHQAAVDADLRATADGNDSRPAVAPASTIMAAGPPLPAAAGEQAAARNMFSAKNKDAGTPSSRNAIILLAAVGALAAFGVGGYFYYQYQQLSVSGARLAATPTTKVTPASTPPTSLPPVPPPPIAGPASGAAPIARPQTRGESPPAAGSAPESPRTAPRETPARAPDSPIRVTTSPQKLDPALASGFASLQMGDFEAARGAYQEALRGDPRNADALTGLATIAAREGQPDRAQTLYAQALESDPKNVVALTALIGMRSQGDPVRAESRLKSVLVAQAPDSAQAALIQFALGNLYGSQRRWNEAQDAYFRAYAVDGSNPDYHYNLAVSLDHLQQTRLAIQFYQSALAAANTRPAAFDRTQTETRLLELQR